MNNSSDYIIIILGQNQTYGHEMAAVFSPVCRTFKSQDPSGNSRRHAGFGPASYTQEDMPMGTTANTGQSTWEQIHGGVRETERLIGQKNYNLAMVKARQTLEYMVKCLCERYGILETGLLEMIDALYSAGKSARPPANITTRSARSATRRSMRETTAPTTPIRRITFCRRRSTPSQMTTMTQKIHPGFPKCSSNPRFFPPSREQPTFLCQLWKRKTCRHTFRQLRGTPSARLCRRSVF